MKATPATQKPGFLPATDSAKLRMAFIGAWVAVLFVSIVAFRLPWEDAGSYRLNRLMEWLLGFAVASGVAIIASRLLLRRVWSLRLGYLLCASVAVLGVGMTLNLSGYCSFPGTWDDPFMGQSDSAYQWRITQKYLADGDFLDDFNNGQLIFYGTLLKIFGNNIIVALLANLMFVVGTVAASGYICAVLFPHRGRRVAFWGALSMAVIAPFFWYSSIFLKEAPMVFGFALFTVAVAKLLRRKFDLSLLLNAAVGAFLLMMLKGPLGWFLMAGVCLVCAQFCRKNPVRNMRLYSFGLCLMLMASAVVVGGMQLRKYDSVERNLGQNDDQLYAQYYGGYDTVKDYMELLPGYFGWSFERRLAVLPFTAAAQYLPPFPWNYTRDIENGRFVWYAHLPWGWYAVGGALLGYMLLCAFRKRRSASLERFAVWFALCYAGVAIHSGGTEPRYWLPFVPMAIPMALQFVACVRSRVLSRRTAWIYSASYLALLGIGLTAAYIFLKT